MRTVLKHPARIVLVICVLALLPALAGPPATSPTPYASALSNLTIGVAMAAKPNNCPDRECVNNKCQHVIGWSCPFKIGPGSSCGRTIQCI